jgi:hypothetical protein
MRTFVFTVDAEWAPPEIVADVLRKFEEAGVAVTLFCTDGPRLDVDPRHEIALHPRITSLEGAEAAVREIHGNYPAAKGIRSHGLVSASQFYGFYRSLGLRYHSNVYLGVPVRRIATCAGIASIPIFFMDHAHLVDSPAPSFSLEAMPLAEDGIYVFVFHPVITFINGHSEEHYQLSKPSYQDPSALRKCIGGRRGTRDLLTDLLDLVCREGIRTSTCLDLLERPSAGISL